MKIGFSDAVRICMKEKYASFEGRATRSEYWYFVLFYCLILFAILIFTLLVAFALSSDDTTLYGFTAIGMILYIIAVLALLCPTISACVRRLHDTGRSGWWYWISLVPYLGGIVLFIFLVLDSEKQDNEYGPYIQ